MNQSILVVDDDPFMREFLRDVLEINGLRVYEADGGQDALIKVKQNNPDALLLDVMMRGMDGITVCKALRTDAQTSQMPIIMLSVLDEEEIVSAGLAAGANKYLTKPFIYDELIDNLIEILG